MREAGPTWESAGPWGPLPLQYCNCTLGHLGRRISDMSVFMYANAVSDVRVTEVPAVRQFWAHRLLLTLRLTVLICKLPSPKTTKE